MSHNIDLKQLEKKAWRQVFADGLWDGYLGLILVAMGLNAGLSDRGMGETLSILIYAAMLLAAGVVLWAGKKYITAPRIGRAKYGASRQRKLTTVRIVLVISLVVGMLAFLGVALFFRGSVNLLNPRVLMPLIWIVNVYVVCGIAAIVLDFKRLWFIATMYAIIIPLDQLLTYLTGLDLTVIAFSLPGVIVVVVGVVLFVRFIREHPVQEQSLLNNGPAS